MKNKVVFLGYLPDQAPEGFKLTVGKVYPVKRWDGGECVVEFEHPDDGLMEHRLLAKEFRLMRKRKIKTEKDWLDAIQENFRED